MTIAPRVPLSVSQNYFHDPQLIESLVQKASIGPQDTVLEIGPGYGIITRVLCKYCRQVVAVEKDARLSEMLKQRCRHLDNLTIQTGDFLHYPLPQAPYKVFSNIPFNLTSNLIAHLTHAHNPPAEAYLVVQKEAARVYTGCPKNTLRSVLLQPWFEMEITHQFQRADFTPRPHVDTVLLHLHKRSQPLVTHHESQLYRDFVVYGFTAWNSAVETTLKQIFSYHQLKRIRKNAPISLDVPPGSLSFADWLILFDTFVQVAGPRAYWKICGSQTRLRRQQKKLPKTHRTRCKQANR